MSTKEEYEESLQVLRHSMYEINSTSALDLFDCGTIIYTKVASYPGRVAVIKNKDGEWKMFDVKGSEIVEREGDFAPTLPALLVQMNTIPPD